MNPETIAKIQQDLASLSETYNEILTKVRALTINDQLYLKKNTMIPPGIACKVAFDQNGLIIRTDKLSVTDIPELQIDHIIGLRAAMNDKVSRSDFDRLKVDLKEVQVKKGGVVGTGIKVGYDSNGLVVSVADLLAEDIPTLPMNKIEGLSEVIEYLKAQMTCDNSIHVEHPSVVANTATKVTYDEHGHVIHGGKLGMNDLPVDLISKINILESRIPSMVSQVVIDGINKTLLNKVDANPEIKPGTYTKVRVDEKGFVTLGDQMTLRDLPQITINDIQDLREELNQKADRTAFMNLSDTVSSITTSMQQISDVLSMRTEIKKKADASDVKSIESRLDSIQRTFDKIVNSIPGDTIMSEIERITSEMSNLGGRLSVIEKKLQTENE